MSLISRLLKANPSAQVSDMLTGYFVIPSAKQNAFNLGIGRALFFGGVTTYPTTVNTIDYVTIATTGNATDFGDLTTGRWGSGALASNTRGVLAGGQTGESGATISAVIDYVTVASTGNGASFGNLTDDRYVISNGANSRTRGLWFGGSSENVTHLNLIEYITIDTLSNSIDFGDLSEGKYGLGSCSSQTRAVCSGGYNGSARVNTQEYVTIATLGNATNFGNSTHSVNYAAGTSSSTRGIFAGGESPSPVNVIEYITIATTGNATDFGDLTVSRAALGGASSSSRGVFGGGSTGSANNTIDYITIDTTGNATDFGDLSVTRYQNVACSDTNGGLQ